MANENTISVRMSNSALGTNFDTTLRFDQTTKRRQAITKEVGTTEETLAVDADVGTPGYARLYNRGATNLRWGGSTGVYIGKIRPGRFALFELDSGSVTLYLLAVTNPVDLDVEILAE